MSDEQVNQVRSELAVHQTIGGAFPVDAELVDGANETIVLEFQLTSGEFAEATFASSTPVAHRHVRWIVGWLWFYALAVALYVILSSPPRSGRSASPDENGIDPSFILWAALLIGVAAHLLVFFARKAARRAFSTSELQEPVTLEISNDGIKAITPTAVSFTQWARYRAIRKTKNLLLIVLSQGPVFVVPKRAFKSEAAMLGFI